MAEKWTMHGKVTCDLCLEEQDIPAGTAPDEDRAKPHLPGWTRIAGQGGWPPAGRILDLCKLCGAVPLVTHWMPLPAAPEAAETVLATAERGERAMEEASFAVRDEPAADSLDRSELAKRLAVQVVLTKQEKQ